MSLFLLFFFFPEAGTAARQARTPSTPRSRSFRRAPPPRLASRAPAVAMYVAQERCISYIACTFACCMFMFFLVFVYACVCVFLSVCLCVRAFCMSKCLCACRMLPPSHSQPICTLDSTSTCTATTIPSRSLLPRAALGWQMQPVLPSQPTMLLTQWCTHTNTCVHVCDPSGVCKHYVIGVPLRNSQIVHWMER